MKFGNRLHTHFVQAWARDYIDYDSYKQQIKTTSPADEVLEKLQLDKCRIDAFLHQRFNIVQHLSAYVSDQSEGIVASQNDVPISGSGRAPLIALGQLCLEALSLVEKLESFATVNQAIVRRILIKLHRPCHEDSTLLLYSRPWMKCRPRLENALHSLEQDSCRLEELRNLDTVLLEAVIQHLGSHDNPLGRSPLHWAAAFDLEGECARLLHDDGGAAYSTLDGLGESSLSLAVCMGHVGVVRQFLVCMNTVSAEHSLLGSEYLGRILMLAIRAGHADIARLVISQATSLNYCDVIGRSPLHVAAQYGAHVEVVRNLLKAGSKTVDVDATESTRRRTALAIACVYGHLDIVLELLVAGATIDLKDAASFTALDHAAYRGHMKIVKAIQEHCGAYCLEQPLNRNHDAETASDGDSDLEDDIFPTTLTDVGGPDRFNYRVGHLLVNLGPLNAFKTETYLDLSTLIAGRRISEVDLTLSVSAMGCPERYEAQLPILEHETLWHFTTTQNPDNCRVNFSILRKNGSEPHVSELLCSGIALLKSLKSSLGSQREPVAREYTIALLDMSGEYAGTLVFNFVVSQPLPSDMDHPPEQRLKSFNPTRIGAHRGLGMNTTSKDRLQIGENTLQSFKSAMAVGASFVELDVQVTKDFVPVIYHDFMVSETGTDTTMDRLSYSQFMAISHAQSPLLESEGRKTQQLPWDERSRPQTCSRPRSSSVRAPVNRATRTMFDRIQHTFEYSTVGVKGNTRTAHIHEPFLTLKETLQELPEDISIDIELKYPMLSEAHDWGFTTAMEINTYVDTILAMLFRHDTIQQDRCRRHIILSSFSPEVCILLALKQRTYPVLFLSDSSLWPTGDPRALSLQSSVHFARRWGLAGVVIAAEGLVASPGLIPLVREERGLFLGSYGSPNDDPVTAKIQADAGIDTLIVNNLKVICKALA